MDLFNNLIDKEKENNVIQSFIKELGTLLENNDNKKDLVKSYENELSILQKVQADNKVTTDYRDKMHVERNNILNNYAKETSDKGTMYFVYSKNSQKDNTYNLCICEEGKSSDIIKVEEKELPKGVGVDSVLRIQNGKYILDKQGTEDIAELVTEMVNKQLKEQEKELSKYRIEHHFYEIVETSGDRVWLKDQANIDGDCFEEINFPKELLNELTEGMVVQYVNGKYCKS